MKPQVVNYSDTPILSLKTFNRSSAPCTCKGGEGAFLLAQGRSTRRIAAQPGWKPAGALARAEPVVCAGRGAPGAAFLSALKTAQKSGSFFSQCFSFFENRSGRRGCMFACSLGNQSRGILNGNPNMKLPMNYRPYVETGSAETTRSGCSRSGASCGRATRGCSTETARLGAAPSYTVQNNSQVPFPSGDSAGKI